MKTFYSLILVSSLASMAVHADSDADHYKTDPVQTVACDCDDDILFQANTTGTESDFLAQPVVSKDATDQANERGFSVTCPLWLKKAGVAVAMKYLVLKSYMHDGWSWVCSQLPVGAIDAE